MSSDPQASAPLILAVDPGNEFSAYVIVENDLSRVVDKGKVENGVLLRKIEDEFLSLPIEYAAIEMVACYGMPVGREVFETCVNIGRLMDRIEKVLHLKPTWIYRKDEKICLCNSMRAKDSNIRQALIDRFGEVGTKKSPGYFYGFKKDIWAAMAVAVAWHDKQEEEKERENEGLQLRN